MSHYSLSTVYLPYIIAFMGYSPIIAVVNLLRERLHIIIELYLVFIFSTCRFTGLEDPNHWFYSFNPCYTYSEKQCQNVYVSE